MSWLPDRGRIDPLTCSYFTDLRHVPSFPIRIRDARLGIMGYSFEVASSNPFVLAFEKVAAAPGGAAAREIVTEIFFEYYEKVQPTTACQAVGVSEKDAPGLAGLPAHLWIAPWGTESAEQRAYRARLWTAKDGLTNRQFLSARDGLTGFGPVTGRKLNLEVKRTLKLAISIRDRGYVPNEIEVPEVFGLRSDREYRWFVIRGQHRFAACAAFDIESIAARVTKIVRREDVAFWPHVISGTYTRAGALKVFDRLFAAKQPVCAARWLADPVSNITRRRPDPSYLQSRSTGGPPWSILR